MIKKPQWRIRYSYTRSGNEHYIYRRAWSKRGAIRKAVWYPDDVTIHSAELT